MAFYLQHIDCDLHGYTLHQWYQTLILSN